MPNASESPVRVKLKRYVAMLMYPCPPDLRRTIVSMAPLVIQQFTGINFAASYSTYYAQLAGYSASMSFKLQIAQQVLSIFGNVISWHLIDKVGRRGLTLW